MSRSSRCTTPGRSGSSPPATRPASACTSVPARWPAPGCTTTPAGLSTTSRCSSSQAIANGASGTSASGARRAARRPRSARPPRRRGAWRAARPSTSTAPPSISRCAAAREPALRARKTSSARRRAQAGRRCSTARRPLEDVEQRQHADRDRDVGDVERRPQRQVDEVGDGALARAVDQVAGGAADQQAGRQPDERPVSVGGEEGQQRRRARPRRRSPRSVPPPLNRPNATPRLRVLTRSRPGSTSIRSAAADRAAHDRLGRLVERRARPTATSGGAQDALRGASRSDQRDDDAADDPQHEDRDDRAEVDRADPQRRAAGRSAGTARRRRAGSRAPR